MKHTEWTIYRSRRLWIAVVLAEIVILALLYLLVGKHAFFLLGPTLLYNAAIYFFPYWYPYFYNEDFPRGPKFQQILRLATETFTSKIDLDLRVLENDFSNILVFANHKKIWLITSSDFISNFSEAELQILLNEIKTLFDLGRLQTATMISALQLTLPVGLWKHNRGTELIFFSQNPDIRWQRLNFKVFHWNEGRPSAPRMPLLPCLMYPALTNYSPASYFSVYNFLREKLISSLKSEETAYGNQ